MMMKNKKLSRREFIRLSAIVAPSVVLAQCTTATDTPEPTDVPKVAEPTDVPPTPEPVSFRYWMWFLPTNEEVYNDLITKFKDVEPNITIEAEYIPDADYYPKLNASIAAGDVGEVFNVYSQMWSNYYNKKTLAPVDLGAWGYGSPEELVADKYMPGVMDFAIKDGGFYAGGMPEFGTWAEAINQDSFDAAGEPYPAKDKPMTWTEFYELANRTTLRDDSDVMTQMGDGSWIGSMDNPFGASIILYPMFHQLGGDPFDEVSGMPTNKDTWLEVANTMWDAAAKNPDAKYGYLDPGFPSGTNAHPELFNGRIANMQAGFWAVGWGMSVNPDLKIDFYPLPAIDADHNATINHGWVYVLSNEGSDAQKVAGSKWLAFLNELDSAKVIFDGGGVTGPLKAQEHLDYMISQSPQYEIFVQENERAKTQVWGELGTERWEIMRKMAENVFKTGTGPEDAVDAAWAEMEALGA
jgi:ABC-type glycerol-3-phosphate transport system substrate-binding protein